MTTNNDILKNKNLNNFIDDKIKSLINNYNNESKKIIKNLVLSGGGIKGIAHVGALKLLEEKGILKNIKNIAGTSIGGIVGFYYSIGYSPDELYNFMELFDFKKVRSVNPSELFKNFGVDDGIKFNLLLEKMMLAKNISPKITFSELFKKTGYTLILTAACLNDKNIYYFSHILSPDMNVMLALRITSAFPLWFIPIKYKNKMFVDGGCIDNYPISIFEKELECTIGIYLTNQKEYTKNINNIEDFCTILIDCLFESLSSNLIKGYEKYTIKIDIEFVGMLDLNITNLVKKQIFTTGYNVALKYIQNNIKLL
jgi:NTE family protein